MRTLHFGLRVADLDRSLAFYTAVGYEIVGDVPETGLGHLTMLKLPDDEFVTVELVHNPTETVGDGNRLSYFVIQVGSMDVTLARLAALFDGATRFAQPTVITDQAAIAHPVDHGGELRCGEVVDASELLRGHAHVEGEEDVSFEAADTLDHQGRDVPVATVLAQQGSCVKETGHHV